MKRTYQQLTYDQRCQISTLIKTDMTQREIAEVLEVNQSTISREINHNTLIVSLFTANVTLLLHDAVCINRTPTNTGTKTCKPSQKHSI